ncbi:bacteriocin fulvocin C-related protein [Nocardia sp. NPDC006044]|uniref:bacteriocin fulvocin C-related protein n=1 Tax=Nocardia sp. NPDC006044 TaxID=3364306 RepID=UPI003691F5FD
MPLADADVRRWREQALGPDTEWVPTLLQVRGDQVRAWHGPRMGFRLAAWLGPVATLRVLTAVGRLHRRASGKTSELPGDSSVPHGVNRAQFLRLVAGAGVAAGVVFAGNAPAFATKEQRSAHAWVHVNRARLPQTYAAIAAYPVSYRRAIFQAVEPAARSRLWVDHLRQYRSERTDLTPGQQDILDRAAELAGVESTFAEPGAADLRHVDEIHRAAVAELGEHEAYRALGVLGPAEDDVDLLAWRPDCECAFESPWCGSRRTCHNAPGIDDCNYASSGCGTFWRYPCKGMCR